MTLGSLFDGSGGFCLAGMINGITPVWSSEIESYPLKVTAKRFPDVKQLGDITKINGAEIDPVDIVTGGSPCTNLSIAGRQDGIHKGEQSSLFFQMIRVIKEMRNATNGRYPRYIVWENVPHALRINGGKDFLAVLEEFAGIADPEVSIPLPERWESAGCLVGDGYSIAWKTYDAQYWGVPQHRRRIYLVADLGGECSGEILFKQEGMSGDIEPSVQRWKSFATNDHGSDRGNVEGIIADMTHAVDGLRVYESGVCPTLLHRMGTGGNQVPLVCYENSGGTYGVSDTLTASYFKGTGTRNGMEREFVCIQKDRKYTLRRLTPLECCRLQGFPSWWEEGVSGCDSARYKMWGNGIALPCAVDVLWRIAEYDDDSPEKRG